MEPGRAVASFDPATRMVRALGRYLAGRGSPAPGRTTGALLSAALGGLNELPPPLAERAFAVGGLAEAVPRGRVGEIDAEALASWIVEHYPMRRYPVVFVGSASGALIHLAAALDAPWLPQTLLIPVRRRGVDRDDPRTERGMGVEPGNALLSANPDLVLHHVHDPVQDLAGLSYFRIKWQRLPLAYRRFLREHLAAGGVLVSAECGLGWPVTRVGERHLFQFGAPGGATVEEYHGGGPRVAALLARRGAKRTAWDPPEVDGTAPEAQWGFEPALLPALVSLAGQEGFFLRRLTFTEPERLSPVVADLYRQWYDRRGLPGNRLLAECSGQIEPWWTLRTGSVPFWLAADTEQSHAALLTYLEGARTYDEIRIVLCSHGTGAIGLAGVRAWQELAGHARNSGTLLGVDQRAYPRDFAAAVRAHRELTRVRPRYEMPEPMGFAEVEPLLRHAPEVEVAG